MLTCVAYRLSVEYSAQSHYLKITQSREVKWAEFTLP